MIRVLVLGADGMLGHALLNYISAMQFDIAGTVRKLDSGPYQGKFPIDEYKIFFGVNAERIEEIARVVKEFRPTVVVNCIGIIKQNSSASADSVVYLNSFLPHAIYNICRNNSANLIHISTDCVFDGSSGNYTVFNEPNAKDLYGKSKALGEVALEGCITLRTSIIGHEIFTKSSLLEWFLAQSSPISGYKRAIFSGVTTDELSKVILKIIERNVYQGRTYHVASSPISKFDLLSKINRIYGKHIEIREDYFYKCDRTLIGDKFNEDYDYSPLPWDEMIAEMYNRSLK